MTKLQTILAGTTLALFSQFAAAQSTGATSSDPAYVDQSRVSQSTDPYVKKRVATKEAKDEYKADKKAAKEDYKDEKKAAKSDYKAAKKDASDTRKSELADPANRPVNPESGK
jgi:Skp family chaperone for outer membrane proteins